MPSFEYKGFDEQGRLRKGLVSGSSVKTARERLAADGVLAESLALAGRASRFPVDTRAMVYREIAALVQAGMPLDQALDLLIRSPEIGESRRLLARVRDRVMEGSTLADAFQESLSSYGPFELAILNVAERSATLEVMLPRLADFLESQQSLRERIRTALVYPAMVLVLGIGSAAVMLGVLVPMIARTLDDGRIAMPGLTRFALLLGRGVTHGAVWLVLLLAGILVAVALRRIRTDPGARCRWDSFLFRCPLVGRGYTLLVNVRFARTLSILISGDIPLIEGLAMAGQATGSAWVTRLARAEAERVEHGKRLSDAVGAIPPLAETLPGWIRTGEAGGGLASILENAGTRYQEHWTRYVERKLRWLEPLLILFVGGFVLLIALAALLPVFSMTRMVGG